MADNGIGWLTLAVVNFFLKKPTSLNSKLLNEKNAEIVQLISIQIVQEVREEGSLSHLWQPTEGLVADTRSQTDEQKGGHGFHMRGPLYFVKNAYNWDSERSVGQL